MSWRLVSPWPKRFLSLGRWLAAWRTLRCRGKLVLYITPQPAAGSYAAGSDNLEPREPLKEEFIMCSRGQHNCQRCPRFEAFTRVANAIRKTVIVPRLPGQDLPQPLSPPIHDYAKIYNMDGEETQVYHLDGKPVRRPGANFHPNTHPQPDPLPHEEKPGCIQNSKRGPDGRQNRDSHIQHSTPETATPQE